MTLIFWINSPALHNKVSLSVLKKAGLAWLILTVCAQILQWVKSNGQEAFVPRSADGAFSWNEGACVLCFRDQFIAPRTPLPSLCSSLFTRNTILCVFILISAFCLHIRSIKVLIRSCFKLCLQLSWFLA